MKLRAFTLSALLAVLLGLVACGEQRPSGAAGITLVPYTSEELGIRGVVPEGWVEVKPGHF